MKGKINKRRLWLLLFAVAALIVALICIFTFLKPDANRLHPENGVLDLQNWVPDQDGFLSLSGEWNFYWSRFITYQDVVNSSPVPDITANAPVTWDSYKLNGKNLSGFGYGTYLLKVGNAQKGVALSLRIPTFSAAYELYIDDRLVSSSGRVDKRREEYVPEYKPRVVEFTPAETSFVLIIHVSNFANTYGGGMWHAISMGTPEQIRNMDNVILYKDLFLFGALSFMAIYYLSFSLLRREDRSSLYFALMCIMIAGRVLIYGSLLVRSLFPFVSFGAISSLDYISLCWFPVFAIRVIGELFLEETSGIVLKIVSFYAAGMTLLFITTPVHFYSGLIYIIQIVALLIGFYAVTCVGRAFVKGRKDSLLLLIGALQLVMAGVHDALYQNNVIPSDYGDFVPFGLFILLFIQSFVLSRRFSEAFMNVHTLSQKLLKLDKIKDEFLANTSHELRTPLSGILGITEAMLKGSGGELNSRQKQDLSIIAGTSRRLANLVNDILDYSKMKNSGILLHIRPIQIQGLIHTVANVFQQLSQSKEYEVISEIPEGLPPVLADENRVVQILYNLVGNAVKFTARGCVKLSVRKTGRFLEVCVSDTGEGIPADRLEDIFQSFEQVDSSLIRRHGGTGLGLPITKHLVEQQGGAIWVESHPGAGSRFYFTLPVSDAAPEETEGLQGEFEPDMAAREVAVSLEKATAITEASEESAHVLLVDDDALSLQAATAMLRLGGYRVTTAGSGKAALGMLERHTIYSLVILDVMMPEMSGYEVCRKLRESWSAFELPVLMLTAKASTEDIVRGFEAGANDYLPKPFEPEELLARVGTLAGLKASVEKSMAAELAFMQAQIKPHFLYNTLTAVSSLCGSDPGRAQQLIVNFSDYLRYCFDFKAFEAFGPLEKELSLVKAYTEIEKARFGDQLKVEFDLDSTVNIRIPILTVQPLVENAINHGFRKKGGGGTVTISVKKVPEGVLVAVADDGLGIPRDRLENLLTPESGHGIGLWNIDGRLKKLFGKGITIESTPGKGTKVAYIVSPVGGDLK